MKIVIAADIFPPQSGGPATYSVALANALLKRGHDVQVVSLNPHSAIAAADGPVASVTAESYMRYMEFLKLLWQHAAGADVVYAMGPVNAGLPAWMAARLRGIRFVCKVVGDYAWEQGVQRAGVAPDVDAFQSSKQASLLVRVLRTVERFVVQKAHVVITPSKYLQRMVIGWGAKEENVLVVYNAVDTSTVEEVIKPDEERWVVTSARLVPWKGIRVLIDVVKKLGDDVRLIVIGDGPEEISLKAYAGGDPKIRFTGRLSRPVSYGYLKQADVFVLNSAYEGLSHVAIEAMVFGTYVVLSDKGGNPELISDAARGQIVSYNDAKAWEGAIRQALDASAPPAMDSSLFSFDDMIDSTEKILESVCHS